jgi:DNA-binding GntR family transcriptional regulator
MLRDILEPLTVTPATARDKVILHVRNQFLAGRLLPGHRVTEVELSDQTGVSRTPVREALRELVHQGLFVAEPYKGVRVSDLNISEIRSVYDVRAELEGFAAYLAAERMTEEEVRRLEAINERMASAFPNVAKCSSCNEEFHNLLSEATKNPYLHTLINEARAKIGPFRMVFHYHSDLVLESVRGHQEIVAALHSKSMEASRRAMQEHVYLGIRPTRELAN